MTVSGELREQLHRYIAEGAARLPFAPPRQHGEAAYDLVQVTYDYFKSYGTERERISFGQVYEEALMHATRMHELYPDSPLDRTIDPADTAKADTPTADERRQQLLAAPQPADQLPSAITVVQAHKCAAIVDALVFGHEGYQQAARLVAAFLHCSASEAAGASVVPTSADLWADIDSYPWPQPGPPRRQPE